MLDELALDLLSDNSIAELAPGSPILVSDNEYSTTDYNSESSYDPSVMTEDEEFIDDSDKSDSSRDCNSLYKPDVSGNSSEEDSDELDDCSTSTDSNITDLSADCLVLDQLSLVRDRQCSSNSKLKQCSSIKCTLESSILFENLKK